ncbi:MAG TPA: ATP-grasp domain-containing protein [Rhodothermales bacterium]|nr:biotin carboxylase [Bacteroidota bacterium]HRK73675.1 ATP-grasp domain-containing protein [Rhodothermales bacterium]HRR09908.1 ATP-grasp domain-containing protein [Rhodothermales bacterium]
MSKPLYTIAVTGLNAIDSPGPGISVIRALRESTYFDVRIVGLAYEALDPGIYMNEWVDVVYQIPYPSNGHQVLLDRLSVIHEQEQMDLIIPTLDAEIIGFIKLKSFLSEMGIKTFLPTIAQFEERFKHHLNQFGETHGILVPRSETVYSVPEFVKNLRTFEYPVVVKGKYYEAYTAHSEAEAIQYYYKLAAKWGTPVVIQAHITGQELNVTALGDGKGALIGAVAMRKTYITQAGKAWAGISIRDKTLLQMAERVMHKTKWAGGMELELIKEEKTGEVYLIEVNPRFPAWVYLSAACGQNHPEALVRLAFGEDVTPMTGYEVGKMFIRYAFDMICELRDFAAFSTQGTLEHRPKLQAFYW